MQINMFKNCNPSKKEVKIFFYGELVIFEIEGITSKAGNWIILIKSATNVLKEIILFLYTPITAE